MDKHDRMLVDKFVNERGMVVSEDNESYLLSLNNSDISERFYGVGSIFDAFLRLTKKKDKILSNNYYEQLIAKDRDTESPIR